MNPPRRYILPAELADQARAQRNRAALALVAMLAAIAAGLAAILHFVTP
jgi:hypothetical protein